MDIIMAFNSGFLLPAIAAIYSLFKNNDKVRLRILYIDLSDTAKIVLNKLQKVGNGNRIDFFLIDAKYIDRIKTKTGRWRPEAFFRYFAFDMFPELDRVLWLDTDILVRKDIKKLYDINFEGRSFAAVRDYTSHPIERLGIRDYVNSGVLLFNMEKLRETGKMTEFWKVIASPDYRGELPDQDALNIVFETDIKLVDQIWNTFPLIINEEADHFIENSRIVHYVSQYKPWKPEDTEYFLVVFEMYRTAKAFVNEYWDVLDEAVEYVG